MTFHDSRGVPIHKGDLLRTLHFIGARRKRYWLYHVAVDEGGVLYMVPTAELEPTKAWQGGRCRLSEKHAGNATVISGCGPEPYLSYEDRPRVRRADTGSVPSTREG